jgi:hypothetical protein
MSAIFPDRPGLSAAINVLFQRSETGEYGRYPILCITNLTVIPENAAIAAKFLDTILTFVKGDSDISEDAVIISYRVVIAPESSKWMDQVEIAERFLVTGEINGKQAMLHSLCQCCIILWHSQFHVG